MRQETKFPNWVDTHVWQALAGGLLVLIIIRLFGLYFARTDLFFDEAQYWAWGQDLDWGYFSKPPVLAWIIRAGTEVCGTTEFCVRYTSPLMHVVSSVFIFLAARTLYGNVDFLAQQTQGVQPTRQTDVPKDATNIALISALAFATLPGLSFSSLLISTDVPLLMFWSAALYFFIQLLRNKSWTGAIGLGVALGAGLMSKYAMAYFILCALIFMMMESRARWLLTSAKFHTSLVIAALMILPNILWNAENGFATFAHTADNAKWGGELFHPGKALEFFAAQFGVFGPILFAGFCIIVWRASRQGLSSQDRLLLTFSIPIILIVTTQALLSRAHANWAATAYPAATILVIATMLRDRALIALKSSFALHAVVIACLAIAPAFARTINLPFNIDPFARVIGWNALADEVEKKLNEGNYGTVLTDDRALTAEFLFYLRQTAVDKNISLRAWRPGSVPKDHFQLTIPFVGNTDQRPVLYVTRRPQKKNVRDFFSESKDLGTFSVNGTSGTKRTFYFYALKGYHPKKNATNIKP